MRPREAGYVLAVDQASNTAGVSLWFDGKLVATTTLNSRNPSDPFSRRIQYQLDQLTAFLNTHLPSSVNIEKVVFEGVRSRLVLIVVGAFMCCPRIDSRLHEKANFISSSEWKKWASLRGATGPFKDIKGVKALREAGWDMDASPVVSDDVADSILLYLTWRDRR